MARKKKDGAASYTAVIRKKKAGKIVLTLSDLFQSRQPAERWMRQTERELKGKGAIEMAVAARHTKTRADVIREYTEASPEAFGKTKTANLAYFQRLDFWQMAVEETDDHDFFRLGKDLLKGVQAPPSIPQAGCLEHYTLQPRWPQSVDSYMATLDLSRFCAAPFAGLGHFPFESDRAFPARC